MDKTTPKSRTSSSSSTDNSSLDGMVNSSPSFNADSMRVVDNVKSSETSDGEMLLYFKTLLGIFSFIEKELQHTKKKLMSDRYDIYLSLSLKLKHLS
jgi:hypothetical protein